MSRKAVTLVEVLVAAGILSIFLVGVMSLFTSGSRGLSAGTWKTKAQKDAQIFLEGLRSTIENSGNALTMRNDSIDQTQLPLEFESDANNAVLNLRTIGANTPMAFMNIVTPCAKYSTLVPAAQRTAGTWMGALLSASPRQLTLSYTNDPTSLPTSVQPWALTLNTDFVAAPAATLKTRQILEDAVSLRFQLETHGDERLLNIEVTLFRDRPGEAATGFTQSVRAKLLKEVALQWF